MKRDEKIKLMAKHNIHGIKKAYKIGGSYGIILPFPWVHWHCTKIDNNYYFQVRVDGTDLILSPLFECFYDKDDASGGSRAGVRSGRLQSRAFAPARLTLESKIQ